MCSDDKPSHFLLLIADVVNETDMVDGDDDISTMSRANLKEYKKELRSSLQDYKKEMRASLDFKKEIYKYFCMLLAISLVVLAVFVGIIFLHDYTLDDKLTTISDKLANLSAGHQSLNDAVTKLSNKLTDSLHKIFDKLSSSSVSLSETSSGLYYMKLIIKKITDFFRITS